MVAMTPPGMARTVSVVKEKTKKPTPASAVSSAFSMPPGFDGTLGPASLDNNRDAWAEALSSMSGVRTPDPLTAGAKVLGMGLAGYGAGKATKAKEAGTAAYKSKLADALAGSPDNTALMGLMADPYADDNSQRMLMEIWQRNNPTEDERLARQKAQLEIEDMQKLDPVKRNTAVVNGRVIDTDTGEEIYQSPTPESKPQIVPKGAQVYDNGEFITPPAPSPEQGQQQVIEDPMKIGKDYQTQPGFERLKQVAPTINSMIASLDDPSAMADLDFVYGLAKILDPTSVVRESEAGMVIDSQGIGPSLLGQLNKILSGDQAMLPEVRQKLVGVALRRAQELQAQAQQEREFYANMAKENGFNPDTYLQQVPVLPDMPVDNEGWTVLPDGTRIRKKGP